MGHSKFFTQIYGRYIDFGETGNLLVCASVLGTVRENKRPVISTWFSHPFLIHLYDDRCFCAFAVHYKKMKDIFLKNFEI